MSTAEQQQADFKRVFLDNDFFSEDVVYTKKNGTAKTIKAVVYRNGLRSKGQRFDSSANSQQVSYNMEIRISKNETDGIPDVKEKEDSITVSKNIGGASSVFRVGAITDQDLATYRLGLV